MMVPAIGKCLVLSATLDKVYGKDLKNGRSLRTP